MNAHTRRDWVLLAGVVLLDTLPFLHRAVHLDENTYLAIARNVSRNFWFPQDFVGQWFGIPLLNFSGHSHPVGLAYYLALLMKVFHSDAEWVLRLGCIVFPLMYAWAGYFLARRYTHHAFGATLLMMVTPAVLVFSPTLMPDLPMTAFWLVSTVSLLAGLDEGKFWKIVLAGFFLVLATLISYQAIFLVGVLAIYAWFRGERRWSAYACLAMPLLFLAAYWYAGHQHYGFWQAERSKKYLSAANIFGLEYFRQKVLGMFSTLGATTVFFVPLLWVFFKREKGKGALGLLLLALSSCAWVPREYSPLAYGEYFLFALGGLAILWMVARESFAALKPMWNLDRAANDRMLLTLWIGGVVLYTILLCEFSATRYLVAIVPPLIILFVLQVEKISSDGARFRKILFSTIACTWIVAAAVAYADYQYVGSYRNFARWFEEKYAPPRGHFWVGSEAGLRYYMEREGARELVNPYSTFIPGITPDAAFIAAHFGRPALGDWMVRPARFLRYDIAATDEISPVIDSRFLTSRFPLRTYDPAAHAGLHGTNVGLLPFAFSWGPFDEIQVSRLSIFAATFDDAKKESPPGQAVAPTVFQVQGNRRNVLALPQPSRLIFALDLPANSRVTGEWTVDDSAAKQSRCVEDFKVVVAPLGEDRWSECAAQRSVFDPDEKDNFSSMPPRKFACALGAFANQKVKLGFESVSTGESAKCPPLGLWNLNLTQTSGAK